MKKLVLFLLAAYALLLTGCVPGAGPRPTPTPVSTRIPTLVPTLMPTITPTAVMVMGPLPEENQIDQQCQFTIPAGEQASKTVCRLESGIYKVDFETVKAPVMVQFQNQLGNLLRLKRVDQQLFLYGGEQGGDQVIGVATNAPLSVNLQVSQPAFVFVTIDGEPLDHEVTVTVTKRP